MLRERLKQLAAEYPRYGYELLHGMLKAEGLVVNEKKTYRIYREEKLQVRPWWSPPSCYGTRFAWNG